MYFDNSVLFLYFECLDFILQFLNLFLESIAQIGK